MNEIICPNCGATTTNHDVCDSCGSALVHFSEKHAKELINWNIIPGLDIAIEENLRLQETIDDSSMVITSVFPIVPPSMKDKSDRKWYSRTKLCHYTAYQIVSSRDCFWGCTASPTVHGDKGVSIRLPFAINTPLPPRKQWCDYQHALNVFRDLPVIRNLFASARYKEGLVYCFLLGKEPNSASKIATFILELIESNFYCGLAGIDNRDINSFGVKTEVVYKETAKIDELGIIVAGAKPKSASAKSQGESSEKKSFWKKLFG